MVDICDPQINDILFELGMKTISMSMNFAVGLIGAHLVEHCTGIEELTVRGLNFSWLSFANA